MRTDIYVFKAEGCNLSKIQRTQLIVCVCVCGGGGGGGVDANDFKTGIFTNSVDPDKTPQKAASIQGLCYLPF